MPATAQEKLGKHVAKTLPNVPLTQVALHRPYTAVAAPQANTALGLDAGLPTQPCSHLPVTRPASQEDQTTCNFWKVTEGVNARLRHAPEEPETINVRWVHRCPLQHCK